MKLSILSPANLSENNGTSIRAKNIFKLFSSKFDVTMISSDNNKFDSLWSIIGSSIIWNLKLMRNLSNKKYDCVYSCSDFLGFFTCFFLSKIFNFNLIFEAHGILSEENKKKGRNVLVIKFCNLIEKFVINHANHVIALSNDIFTFYKKFNNNIDLIPVFVDDIFFLEESKDMNMSSRTVGLIGPFDMPANKYYLNFLYKHLNDFDERINFLIIGKCDERVNKSNVRYTGYLKSLEEYAESIRSLDALLVPSNISTSGPLNKILEAMACNVPVFTTPEGVIGLDYMRKNENVFIFSAKNLVEGVNKNIFKRDLLLKISKTARQMVERYYSKNFNFKKLLNIIKDYRY